MVDGPLLKLRCVKFPIGSPLVLPLSIKKSKVLQSLMIFSPWELDMLSQFFLLGKSKRFIGGWGPGQKVLSSL